MLAPRKKEVLMQVQVHAKVCFEYSYPVLSARRKGFHVITLGFCVGVMRLPFRNGLVCKQSVLSYWYTYIMS